MECQVFFVIHWNKLNQLPKFSVIISLKGTDGDGGKGIGTPANFIIQYYVLLSLVHQSQENLKLGTCWILLSADFVSSSFSQMFPIVLSLYPTLLIWSWFKSSFFGGSVHEDLLSLVQVRFVLENKKWFCLFCRCSSSC